MKLTFRTLIPLLLLGFLSCGGGDDHDDVAVGSERIEVPDITILADGGEKQVTVSANCAWVITVPAADSWLSINPTYGTNTQAITIKCTENKSNNSRTSVVTISGKQRTTAFKITQNPTDDVVDGSERIEVPDITILAEGGEKQVAVNANCAWVISVPASDTWLSINPTSGTNSQNITIKCEENRTNNTRTSVVAISGKQRTTAFKVIQNPPVVVSINVGNFSLSGLTNNCVDYTFSISPVSDDITSCGVFYSMTNNEPTSDDMVSFGTRNDNIVHGTVSSLATNTIYYVRAFVTNPSGTYYSQTRQITTENNVPGRNDNEPPA